jgi:hypothetical protein
MAGQDAHLDCQRPRRPATRLATRLTNRSSTLVGRVRRIRSRSARTGFVPAFASESYGRDVRGLRRRINHRGWSAAEPFEPAGIITTSPRRTKVRSSPDRTTATGRDAAAAPAASSR